MMRIVKIVLFFFAVGYGGYWCWERYPSLRNICYDICHIGTLQTLEARYSAESIMELHRRQLLPDAEHSFLAPKLKFYPYLLLEVKYAKPTEKTAEGLILWSLMDGEMVLNTTSWEQTHGLHDCIHANAGKNEFKIINALALHGGTLDHQSLSKILNIEDDKLNQWLDSCRKKSLIIQSGNYFRLHLQNPKLPPTPETKLNQWLVTKPSKAVERVAKLFRPYQIEETAKAAFGDHFAIRNTREVFLPVYRITVQNPDGTQMITYWNALTGKQIKKMYPFES